jgi:hypothetical protein
MSARAMWTLAGVSIAVFVLAFAIGTFFGR